MDNKKNKIKTYKNLKISDNAKVILDKTKRKFNTNTYDELIISMCEFFRQNNITPSTKIERSLNDNIIKLTSKFEARDKSLRSFIGRIESEFLKKMNLNLHKLLLLHEEEFKQKVLEESNNKDDEQNSNNNDEKIEALEKQIKRLNLIISEKTIEIQETNNKYHTLYKRFQIKKSTFSEDKYIIELSKSDYENLYN
ncbi:BfmA/BtgA family mobilization protein [Empedobacter stercoris]|uniref:BfmA/BtgA family mobilization protein n=1 Tax=Empedobacter stercoris TaxID=1628248 RepID=UPI0039EBA439